MKVLHFHFGKDGGAEGFFVHLVNALAARGVDQKAIIRPDRSWRPEIEGAADIAIEDHFRNTTVSGWTLPHRARRLVRSWRPDAVFAWMSRAGHLLPGDPAPLRLGRLGDYPDRLTQFKNADVLVCNTPGIAERVRRLGWTKRVEVVTNFTDVERVAPHPRAELCTPDGAPLVCAVGRMVGRKGFDVVVRAIARLPGVYLWLVGDGPEATGLRSLAEELGVLDRVRFTGWRNDPRPYTAAADVSAMASSHEPLGNVILEGWAQRVPVVATRSEGPTWLIQPGENGLLANIGDDAGFADALRRALQDAALRDRLVAGGEASLAGRFSERAVVDRYLKVLGGEVAEPLAA